MEGDEEIPSICIGTFQTHHTDDYKFAISAYWGPNDERNSSKCLREEATNLNVIVFAAIDAIVQGRHLGFKKMKIYTSSPYLFQNITVFLGLWIEDKYKLENDISLDSDVEYAGESDSTSDSEMNNEFDTDESPAECESQSTSDSDSCSSFEMESESDFYELQNMQLPLNEQPLENMQPPLVDNQLSGQPPHVCNLLDGQFPLVDQPSADAQPLQNAQVAGTNQYALPKQAAVNKPELNSELFFTLIDLMEEVQVEWFYIDEDDEDPNIEAAFELAKKSFNV